MSLLGGRIFKNASWIIISKLLQSICAFFIGILAARYLGPSNYGLINYAASIVTFVLPISQLGFSNVLVQELTCDSQNEGKILGTSIFMSTISAIFCMVGVVSFASATNVGETETVIIVAIYSVNLIFQMFDMIQYWFQSKLLSKYSSIASLVAYLIVSCYKLFLLITQKNVYWFAASYAIDYSLIALFLIILYCKLGGQKLSLDLEIGKRMFAKSKHYIVTGLMVAIFSHTDKIMIKELAGDVLTGYYSVAVAIASIPSFAYAAIIDSYRPIIFSSQNDKEKFEFNLKNLYCIVFWLSFAQSVVMTIFSRLFVNILYGKAYADASDILGIVVWFIPFSYLGSIRNIWILANNKQKYLWIINASGACLNVVLNLVLIPYCGAVGAAVASVLTQMFSNFILGFIVPPIRENNFLLIRSLNPKRIYDLIKNR